GERSEQKNAETCGGYPERRQPRRDRRLQPGGTAAGADPADEDRQGRQNRGITDSLGEPRQHEAAEHYGRPRWRRREEDADDARLTGLRAFRLHHQELS